MTFLCLRGIWKPKFIHLEEGRDYMDGMCIGGFESDESEGMGKED